MKSNSINYVLRDEIEKKINLIKNTKKYSS